MIAKHFPMKSLGKSDFSGLVKYLSDSQNKNERVGDINITNCNSVDIDSAILEVLATQQINQRASGDKTYHLLISFAPDEKVTDKQLKEIEQRFIDVLGFTDHQRVSVVHHDTDSLHVHLAINKINPKKHTMHEPFLAYKAMSALCTKIEDEYGLVKVNHHARKTKSENLADDMERHTGVETLLNWIKRNCVDELREAKDWQEFKNTLDANGLSIRVKANGFVIETYERLSVKASSVDREFSKQNLEKKFGAFVDEERKHRPKPKKQYIEKPLSKGYDTTELYALYKRQQDKSAQVRVDAMALAKEKKARKIKSAKLTAKVKRDSLKLMKLSSDSKRRLYSLISHSLVKNISNINADYRNSTQTIYSRCKKQVWADWLRTQAMNGNEQAIAALRGRSGKDNLIFNTITGNGKNIYVSPMRDNITKEGVVIYSNKRFAIRDDGKHIKVSRDASHDGVIAALQIAVAKYGNVIKVDGDKEFKEQALLAAVGSDLKITFSDNDLNKRLIELRAKYASRPGYRSGIKRAGFRGQYQHGNRRDKTAKQPQELHARERQYWTKANNKNDMRNLSELVMAFEKRGTNMPLPDSSHNNLVNREQGSDRAVRREPDNINKKGKSR